MGNLIPKMPKLKMPKISLKSAMPKMGLKEAFNLKPPEMHNLKIPSISKAMGLGNNKAKFAKIPAFVKPPKIVHTERLSDMGKGIKAMSGKKIRF